MSFPVLRCLFCKRDAAASRSREHVIPESLGNTTLVLPRGVVCDSCNNYFSREVERPFLESEPMASLRFQEALPSKRGRIPPAAGVLTPDVQVSVERLTGGEFAGIVTVDDVPTWLKRPSVNREAIWFDPGPAAPDHVTSRFLAKVGLEAIAARLVGHPDGLAYLVDEVQLDPVRWHAREGARQVWPYHARRLYPATQAWTDGSDGCRQVKWELDLLVTERSEWYVILVVFGLELVLNLGGPDISGYVEWLWRHGHRSPLYVGRNEHGSLRPIARPQRNRRAMVLAGADKVLIVAKRH
jgi:hypothetical protein